MSFKPNTTFTRSGIKAPAITIMVFEELNSLNLKLRMRHNVHATTMCVIQSGILLLKPPEFHLLKVKAPVTPEKE